MTRRLGPAALVAVLLLGLLPSAVAAADPVAVNDEATVDEDSGATTVDVLANDTGDAPLTVVSATDPTNGTVVIAGDNLGLTYQPAANFHGSDSFDYTITDGATTGTATVTITVTSVNDPPNAVADSAAVAEDAAATTIDVLANDTDIDGHATLSIQSATNPPHGTVVIAADKLDLTYAPDANYHGPDSFSYTITDGITTDSALVSITVTSVNDPPNAVVDSATVAEDSGATIIDVLINDTDVDGPAALTIQSATNPPHGTVVIAADKLDLTYAPDATYHGLDSFSYTITDGITTDSAVVSITVTSVNHPPTCAAETASGAEDTVIGGAVGCSDIDGNPLTYVLVTDATHGTADFTSGPNYTYTPDANYHGPDSFTFRANDGTVNSATATASITVTSVNDPPNAVADSKTVLEDAAATTIDVLANDTDVDGPAALTIQSATNPPHGTVAIAADKLDLTYRPDADYHGPDSFTYTITDGTTTDSALVSLTVTSVNDPPNAVADSKTVLEDSGATTIEVLANDTDIDGPADILTITSATDPAHGTVVVAGSNLTLTYQPEANYHGPDSFSYSINDGHGGTDSAVVSVTVTSVNDIPNAVADSATVAEDSGATTVNVLANDTDADTGDILTITSATNGVHGLVAITSLGTRLTYTPNLDFNGSDIFTYTVSDGHGGTDIGTVTVTVTPVNDNPIAVVDIAPSMLEDAAPTTIDVLANDTDPDIGDVLAITAKTDGGHGAVTIIGGGADVSYQPALDFNGSDTFTYTVSDGHGGTDIGTVTVTVTPVNDNPTAADDVVTVPQNQPPAALPVLINDSDVDGDTPLIITNATNGSKGIVVVTSLNGPGTGLTYQPFHNASGADSFTYTISDGHGGLDSATVSVSISGINHPPNATNDGVVVPINIAEGAAATVLPVLANDTDPDGDSLFITTKTNGAHGTVTITGGGTGLRYKPAAHFHGTDQFTYTVGDGHGGSDGAIVLVTVLKDKTKPVATAPAESYPGQTIGTTTSKARLAWSASDAGSGIARYTLQVSVNGSRFATVALGSALSRSVARTLTDGKRYRFRVRATDGEGNVGNWAYGPTFKPTRFQDTTSSVKYTGSWTKTALKKASGGTTRHTSSASGTARFTATAYDLGWIVTKTTSSGSAQVWIDGVFVTTINLHASTTKYRQLAYQIHFATHAIHTIEIRRMSGRVDLDAFAILR